jgi:hypothetical protein
LQSEKGQEQNKQHKTSDLGELPSANDAEDNKSLQNITFDKVEVEIITEDKI